MARGRLHIQADAEGVLVRVAPSFGWAAILLDAAVTALWFCVGAILIRLGASARAAGALGGIPFLVLFIAAAGVGVPFLTDLCMRLALQEEVRTSATHLTVQKRLLGRAAVRYDIPIQDLTAVELNDERMLGHLVSHLRGRSLCHLGAVAVRTKGSFCRIGLYLGADDAAALAMRLQVARQSD